MKIHPRVSKDRDQRNTYLACAEGKLVETSGHELVVLNANTDELFWKETEGDPDRRSLGERGRAYARGVSPDLGCFIVRYAPVILAMLRTCPDPDHRRFQWITVPLGGEHCGTGSPKMPTFAVGPMRSAP